jgi:hypothetical protein
VNAKATANAIQNAYAMPASAKSPRGRRVLILGGVATALALGLGSFLFGMWGDPERLLGLTGTSSVAVVAPALPVQVPAPAPAPAPEASASAPALSVDTAIAAKLPADTPVASVAETNPPSGRVVVDAGATSAPLPTSPSAKPAATQSKELALRPT